MPRDSIGQYSTTPGDNTDIGGINIGEGMAPSDVNNSMRELLTQLKEFQIGTGGDGVTVGGDFVVSGTSTSITALTASQAVFTNASKALVSNAITGTGNVVMSTSPTLVTPVLGTPSSGTVTNLTGTASININGTVGATTPATGSFTTLNTSGQVVFNDAGADVDFRVEGDTNANLLVVDASADSVGIGINSPNATLQVLRAASTGEYLRVGANSGGPERSLRFSTFTVAATVDVGHLINAPGNVLSSGGTLAFATNSTERMRIDSAGNVDIANGNLKFTTNGTGIDFSASAGGGATSSLLDDYEEGTFTPELVSGFSTAPTGYSTQGASYIKIGRFVYCQIRINANGAVSNASVISIGGLPFSASASAQFGVGVINYQAGFNTNAGDTIEVNANGTTMSVFTAAGAFRLGNAANVDINSEFIFNVFYLV